MTTICPAVLAENPHQYREQVERVAAFATRIHLDFTDGEFTSSQTITLSQAWWPHTMQADLHIMYQRPGEYLEEIIALNPHMVIVHAEAEVTYQTFANALHQNGILFGVAVMPETTIDSLRPHLSLIDHILIFSGDLGKFGGEANLRLLDKVSQVKKMKSTLTIGWDGGVNDTNVQQLIDGGVDVVNVGGFIQRAEDPQKAYQSLLTASQG